MFLASMDTIVMAAALPAVRADLGVDTGGASWVMSAYTIPFAVCMVAAGVVVARWGQARSFEVSAGLFGLASLGCAASGSLPVLVAFRCVQGLSAALLVPLAAAVVIAAAPDEARRNQRIGYVAAVQGAATVLAPFLGGLMVAVSSWRLVFAINVPLILGFVTARRRRAHEKSDAGGSQPQSLPLRALALAVSGLTLVAMGLLRFEPIGRSATSTGWALGCLTGGVALLRLFWRHDRCASQPLVPNAVARSAAFGRLCVVNVCVTAGLLAAALTLLLYLQDGLGYSPAVAGALTLPCTLAPVVTAMALGRIIGRVGAYRATLGGASLQAIGLAGAAASLVLHLGLAATCCGLGVSGLGVGLFAPASTACTVSMFSRSLLVEVTALSTTTKELGILGGTVLGAVLVTVFCGDVAAPEAIVDGTPAVLGACAAMTLIGVVAMPRSRGTMGE